MKISTLILGLLLINAQVQAQDKEDRRKGEFIKKELNLTDEQLDKVKEIRKSDEGGIKKNREEFKKLKEDFNNAIKNKNASNEELSKKFEAFQKARDEFQRQRFAKLLKMREILTPDQLEKFQDLKKKKKDKWRKNQKSRK